MVKKALIYLFLILGLISCEKDFDGNSVDIVSREFELGGYTSGDVIPFEHNGELFEPAQDKVYRHPTFYELPDEVKHM